MIICLFDFYIETGFSKEICIIEQLQKYQLINFRCQRQMGESMKVALGDALKMVGIVESTKDATEVPQASWDLYEMIQACIQVCECHLFTSPVLYAHFML